MIYKDREEFLKLINELNLKIGCEIGVYKGDYSIKILEKTNLSKFAQRESEGMQDSCKGKSIIA